ncbi:Extended synaptotagmin-2 [Gryllus bimaculatus]|nr:Extended synaptotagmin-2 [Gryllus bimaculatus]
MAVANKEAVASVATTESEESTAGPVVPRQTAGMSISNMLYSFGKKLGTVAAVYLLGYFDLSFAWLLAPVLLSVVRDEWKKDHEARRCIAKAAATRSEREVILARVDDLPSWVYFPDVERVEWLNRILRQLWPNVNHYARTLLKNSIEPGVRDSLAQYKLQGFRFEKMVLGNIPMRIGGVKVYDLDLHRKEIMLDMDLFYAGDCDISFSLGGLKGGIKDFQIHGMVRVVMKPLISDMPLVGGLQIFFLNNPTVDFNLVGVADMLDMPGISDLLRRTIVEVIAGIMVLPNKLPIQLSDSVQAEQLRMPELEGVLRIHVVEARNLMKKDISMLGKGKSDPYAIITVGAEEFRTKTIDNTVNPKWDFWCESIVCVAHQQEIQLQLYDADDLSKKDESLGRATVEVSTIAAKGEADLWLNLDGAKHGTVHVRFTWLTLTADTSALLAALKETQHLRMTSLSTAVLMVYIDSAKDLPGSQSSSKINPYVQLSLGHKQQQTPWKESTRCPVFEQGFTFLVGNPESDTLDIRVINQKSGSELGQLIYNLTGLLEKDDLHVENQPFPLARAGEGEGADDAASSGTGGDHSRAGSLRRPPDSPAKSASSTLLKQGSGDSLGTSTAVNNSRTPVDDPMVIATAQSVESVPPGAGSDTSGLHQRSPSVTSSAGEAGLGRIQLTLRYSIQTQKLIIIVHRVANLPLKDKDHIPDPYVKLYLLPDRSKDSKRKTETLKDNLNPVYDERFEYLMSQAELNSSQLEVSVVTKKSWLSSQSPVLGQVILNLGDLGLPKACTIWFDLLPEVPRDS